MEPVEPQQQVELNRLNASSRPGTNGGSARTGESLLFPLSLLDRNFFLILLSFAG
jgi:hypothetical protein